MSDITKITFNNTDYNLNSGTGMSIDFKVALDSFMASVVDLADYVAYSDAYGQSIYDDLSDMMDAVHNAMYPPAGLESITAVYTQSGAVYTNTPLYELKADLVVTAHYDSAPDDILTANEYVLSGTLSTGTSTITVAYGGKTTTFNVTVTLQPGEGWQDGVPYEIGTLIQDEYVQYNGAGEIKSYVGWDRTDYMPCKGAASIDFAPMPSAENKWNSFYDANKQFVASFTLATTTKNITVPSTACFWIVSSERSAMASFANDQTIPNGE